MRKTLLSAVFSVVALSGCETATQLGTMSQSGTGALSCSQIQAAFSAYERDRNSMDSWVQLIKQINPSVDPSALAGDYSPSEMYDQARSYANVALAVQGCAPIQG